MTPDLLLSRAVRRRLAGFVCLWLCVATGGCSLLEDEFTWLDRAGPAVHSVLDGPVSGVVSRP